MKTKKQDQMPITQKILSVKEVRAGLTDLLYEVKKMRVTIVITKNGRQFAKLVPCDELDL